MVSKTDLVSPFNITAQHKEQGNKGNNHRRWTMS